MVDSSITLIYAPFPSLETAQSVARQLIEEQLAACCNLIPGMQSIYRWEGAIEEASEVVLLVKTTAAVASAAVARIAALHAHCPGVEWIIDANAGYRLDDALTLVAGLRRIGIARCVLEQPVAADALEDLARLATEPGIQVLADESVRSVADIWRLLAVGHVQAINVKLAKSGVFEALRMARLAQRHGLGLMIGGMVETRLGMGMSAQVAAGLGGFGLHDLDTPLLLVDDPIKGGYRQRGPCIEIVDDQVGAFRGELERYFTADTTARSGDQSHLAFEFHDF
jgi:L-alanine-DL-glutamate epimerase-like enolase superfamily enzyme